MSEKSGDSGIFPGNGTLEERVSRLEQFTDKNRFRIERLESQVGSELGTNRTTGNVSRAMHDVRDEIKRLEEKMEHGFQSIDHKLRGNGEPGLITQVHRLMDEHKEREQDKKDRKSQNLQTRLLFIGAILTFGLDLLARGLSWWSA